MNAAPQGARKVRGSALLTALVAHGLGAWLVLSLVACSGSEGVSRFRLQYEDWYRTHPPATTPPSGSDLALLERHRPIYWLGEESDLPIRFYEDYIAHGTFFDGDGKSSLKILRLNCSIFTLATRRFCFCIVLKEALLQVRLRSMVVFAATQESYSAPSGGLCFLPILWSLPRSGLLAGLSWWQEWSARTFADANDWHQLDHYINVTLALDEEALERGETIPLAVEFQHHNYTRTWRLGGAKGTADDGYLAWPASGRLEVDIALRSNEAYPHIGNEPQRHPAASFLSEKVGGVVHRRRRPPHLEHDRLGSYRSLTPPRPAADSPRPR